MKVRLKEFIKSPYGLIICISWIALIICLIIKLFGGNWFELWLNNDKFISFCEFVDNTQWLKMILACVIYLGTGYPVLCIMLNNKVLNLKETLIFIPLMIIKSICGWYILWLAYIIDMLIIVLLPLIFRKFKNWKMVIIGNILIILFQFLTLTIRNIGFGVGFNNENIFLIQVLYQIDYYIMILLFYMYYFKFKSKEVA